MIEKKRRLGILCILAIAAFFVAGLWPFDFSPRNCVHWLPEGRGLYFDGKNRPLKLSEGGIAYTPCPLGSSRVRRAEPASLTIEIQLEPAKESNSDIPHILSLFESKKEMLYVGQWKKSMILRWFPYERHKGRMLQEMEVENALIAGKSRWVTIVSDRNGTAIYLDGELAKHFSGKSLLAQGQSIEGQYAALGNSPEFKSPWAGSVRRLSLYERSLSEREVKQSIEWSKPTNGDGLISAFNFEERQEIVIPDLSGNKNHMVVPENPILMNSTLAWPDWSVQNGRAIAEDLIVNVLGFVPLGFLFAFWQKQSYLFRRWRPYLFAILVGSLISLGIEIGQAYIPARDSSMVDLVCNTAGAFFGAGFWVLGRGALWIWFRGQVRKETA